MYDVVIIGSGLGGLECAYILSKRGKRVLVLERQKHPGGCMQSYRRGDAMLDTGLHYVGGLDDSQPLHDAFKELGLLDLPWYKMDHDVFEQVTMGGRTYSLAQGFDSFRAGLLADFPEDAPSIDRYIELMKCTDEVWMQQTNAWDYLNSIISNPLLLQVVSAASVAKMELHKDTLPLFTYVHGNAAYIQSSWRLIGDGNILVNRLIDGIKNNGGDVICRSEVVELVEKNGVITSAICSDGTCYEAQTFICNIHPAKAVDLVKESTRLKRMFRMRMNNAENTRGIFTLSLTLEPGSLNYFNHNKYIYNTSDAWDMAIQTPEDHVQGVMISCRVPEDGGNCTHALDILTPMSWEAVSPWKDTCLHHRDESYKEMKQRIADECLDLAEQKIPELRESIQKAFTSTPLTWRDYNLTPNGSAFGMRKDFNNPLGTVVSSRTPIPNLLLTGQSLMLHGLHGVTMTALETVGNVR